MAILDFEGRHVDSGTAFEIGFATALGKPVVVFHEGEGEVNVMISEPLRFYCKKVGDLEEYDFLGLPKNRYTGDVF